MTPTWMYSSIVVVSALVAASLCPLVERIAVKAGAVDHPGGRHIHLKPTARLGGIAVGCGLLAGLLVATVANSPVRTLVAVHSSEFMLLGVGAALMLLLGVIDDFRSVRPSIKLFAEILSALAIVAAGHQIQFAFGLDLGWLRSLVTVVWVVAIINAINMVDGLDGLAGGVSLIIGTTLFAVSTYLGNIISGLILVGLCGGLAGFLPFNYPPARIFLGDSGSLLIGYCLAFTAIQSSSKAATVVAITFPFLALGLPLAELLLTTVRRLLRTIHVVRWDRESRRYEFFFIGRPALFTADRDHIHHRLLALGFSPRRTILSLYAACAICGVGSFAIVSFQGTHLASLLAGFVLFMMVCVRQLKYGELSPIRSGLFLPLFDTTLTNRRIVHGVADFSSSVVSICTAYLIYENGVPHATWMALRAIAPLVILIQIACLAASGLYRRAFRQSGIADLLAVMKALVFAIVFSWMACLVVLKDRVTPLSVSMLDAYLLITTVMLSRFTFLVLDYVFKSARVGKRRVIIYGAGGAGVAAFRQIQSNPDLDMQVIGFVDQDFLREGQLLNGVMVYSSYALDAMIGRGAFHELIIATPKMSDEQTDDLWKRCGSAGIRLSRFIVDFEEVRNTGRVDDATLGPAQLEAIQVTGK
jgi:UDP-GlcNAc:undecaprenyl-phosphate GlcNAc-1-phosphate transferase